MLPHRTHRQSYPMVSRPTLSSFSPDRTVFRWTLALGLHHTTSHPEHHHHDLTLPLICIHFARLCFLRDTRRLVFVDVRCLKKRVLISKRVDRHWHHVIWTSHLGRSCFCFHPTSIFPHFICYTTSPTMLLCSWVLYSVLSYTDR